MKSIYHVLLYPDIKLDHKSKNVCFMSVCFVCKSLFLFQKDCQQENCIDNSGQVDLNIFSVILINMFLRSILEVILWFKKSKKTKSETPNLRLIATKTAPEEGQRHEVVCANVDCQLIRALIYTACAGIAQRISQLNSNLIREI